jgi:hypothetical protein
MFYHLGGARHVRAGDFTSIGTLDAREIEILLERAIEIGSRYNHLYRRATFSRGTLGDDDFKSLLSLVRAGLNSLREP